jgi:hypothetical protein
MKGLEITGGQVGSWAAIEASIRLILTMPMSLWLNTVSTGPPLQPELEALVRRLVAPRKGGGIVLQSAARRTQHRGRRRSNYLPAVCISV